MKRMTLLGGLVVASVVLVPSVGLAGGSAGPRGGGTCSDCHDDTTLILSKRLQSR